MAEGRKLNGSDGELSDMEGSDLERLGEEVEDMHLAGHEMTTNGSLHN